MLADSFILLARTFVAVLPVYVVWCVGRGLFLLNRTSNRDRRGYGEAALWVLILYLLMLLEITVLRSGDDTIHLGNLSERIGRMNLLPFTEIIRMIRYADRSVRLINLLGNLLWFLPAGILPPLLWPKLRRFFPAVLAGASLSLMIELAQLLRGTGVTDVDDLILNTAGTALGYGLFMLAGKWIQKRKNGKAGLTHAESGTHRIPG